MNGYDYMMQVRRLDLQIRRIGLQIQELESCLLPQGIRYDKDKVQTSPEDQLSRIVAKASDLRRKQQRLIRKKGRLVIEISENIERLSDENEKTVLTAYFLSRMQMTDIAAMIGYSTRQTYNIRQKGLQKIARIAK